MRAATILKEILETEILSPGMRKRAEECLKEGAATEMQRKAARDEHGSDEIEVDEDAQLSEAEGGYWVSGWLWVAHND